MRMKKGLNLELGWNWVEIGTEMGIEKGRLFARRFLRWVLFLTGRCDPRKKLFSRLPDVRSPFLFLIVVLCSVKS